MRDHQDEVIGVVQLINKKRDAAGDAAAGVALVDEHRRAVHDGGRGAGHARWPARRRWRSRTRALIQDIRTLFDSFVRASVTAIESRDPTTSGHSGAWPTLTVEPGRAGRTLSQTGPFRDVRFTPRPAPGDPATLSLLHDFGKVGVREKVLIKGKKLYVGEMLLIRQRFAYIKRTLEAEHLRELTGAGAAGPGAPDAARTRWTATTESPPGRDRRRSLRMILQANEPTILEEESFRALMDLPVALLRRRRGQPPALPHAERGWRRLSIRRGSLSEKERREIESHVTHTFRFLVRDPLDAASSGACPRSPTRTTRRWTAPATRAKLSRRRTSRSSRG